MLSLNCPLSAIGFALYSLDSQLQGSSLADRSVIMRKTGEGNGAGKKPETELYCNCLVREAEKQIIEIRKKTDFQKQEWSHKSDLKI